MTQPRIPFYGSSFTIWCVRRSSSREVGVVVAIGVVINVLLSAFGQTVWGTESRRWLNVMSMVTITVAAIVMTVRNERRYPSLDQVVTVTGLGTLWIVTRITESITQFDAWFGSPAANLPLETAIIVFTSSRLFRWPEVWIAALSMASYSLYVFLPASVPPTMRDIPVTFSFVLFACLAVSWWIKAWIQRRENPPAKL